MPLDDADRIRLEEIEHQLERENGHLARAFRKHRRVQRELAVPCLAAAVIHLAALGALSLITGSAVPVLIGLAPVAATLVLLRWPDLFRMVPAEPRPRRPPGAGGP